MDIDARLASVDDALADGRAQLTTNLGGHHELTSARLWRGDVLVDWEPDATAGGCLLRPALLRRLIALHARTRDRGADQLELVASGRIVSGLSPDHADLVSRIGGAARIELSMTLRFDGTGYRGGDETYSLVERGQRVPIVRLTVEVLPHTSPAPT
jgi:hypothetical protein